MPASLRPGKSPGTWVASVYLGRLPSGSPRVARKTIRAESEEEAREAADRWADGAKSMGPGASALDMLRAFADSKEANGASPNTVRAYRLYCDYAARYLRGKAVSDVAPADVREMEQSLMARGALRGGGLSRSTVLGLHRFLHAAWSWLMWNGYADSNPLDKVEKPRPDTKEAPFLAEWDMAQLSKLLSEAMGRGGWRGCVAYAAWIALHTGVRVGECCALRRRDLYVRQRYVHVCGNVVEAGGVRRRDVTKGRRNRNVAVTREVMDEMVRRARERGGGGDAPLVTVDGKITRPSSVSRTFTAMARSIGLPAGFTFHDLRHTHAAWCLSHGADLKTLSERLGHADEATTLRVYAHVLPGRDKQAAQAFEDALRDISDQ